MEPVTGFEPVTLITNQVLYQLSYTGKDKIMNDFLEGGNKLEGINGAGNRI